MNVRLHIERLVLEGLALGHGEHLIVRAAAESELARLLSSGRFSPELLSGGAVPRLSASEIHLPGEVNPRQLGRAIAGAVYRRMER